MGFRRAFRRATRSISRLGRSASGFVGGLTGRGRSDDGAGEGYQGIDPNQYKALQDQFGQLQNQYNQLNGQYQQLAQNNKSMTDQYGTLNNQFNQMMNQYKAMVERNSGLQSTIDDKNKAIQQEQLNREAEKSKYDALNQAIGERGKFDQSTDEGNGQGAGENSYGIDKKGIDFTSQVNPNGDMKDDDDIKRRLSRILQERGQIR